MSMAAPTAGTTTQMGPGSFGLAIIGSTFMQPVVLFAAAAISTTTPAPAAVTLYEDTASRTGMRRTSSIRPVDADEAAAVSRIHALSKYEAGWHGPDSVGPTVETVRQAIDFARGLTSLGRIARPYISLASDGEINFYWKTEAGLTMDLGFTGTSRYSYFAETRDGREFIEEGAELNQPLPAELIAALRA